MNKSLNTYLQVFFIIGILVLTYLLYNSILEPIEFDKERKIRVEICKNKLIDLRAIQLKYRESKGVYCSSLDKLIDFALNDSVKMIKQFGDENDTSVKVIKEIVWVDVKDVLYKTKNTNVKDPEKDEEYIKNLKYVPFTQKKELFEIEAKTIKKSGLELPVFMIRVKNPILYNGLVEQYYDKNGYLQVGSLEDTNLNGNWE